MRTRYTLLITALSAISILAGCAGPGTPADDMAEQAATDAMSEAASDMGMDSMSESASDMAMDTMSESASDRAMEGMSSSATDMAAGAMGGPTAALAVGAASGTVPGGGLTDALTSQLGVSPEQAAGGAGAIFQTAQQTMSPGDFAQVASAVPDMDGLLAAAPAAAAVGGGGIPGVGSSGGLGGAAAAVGGAGALGGAAGSMGTLSSLAGPFDSLGMSPDMAGQFVPVIMDYMQSTGGGSAASLLQSALF